MGKHVRCPLCGEKFELEDDLMAGDSTWCDHCYGELRIVELDPPKLEEATDLIEDEAGGDEEAFQ
jgi:lysine biosynthesis protein LysW